MLWFLKKNKEIIVMTKWNLVWPCISSIVCLSTPQGNQCEISHFQASVGACNLILHIHVVVKWQLSSRVSPEGNTQLFHGLRCLPREVMCFFEVTCTCWQVTSFSTDSRLNSKCISVNGYKFIVWSKLYIYQQKLFFGLCSIYIKKLYLLQHENYS